LGKGDLEAAGTLGHRAPEAAGSLRELNKTIYDKGLRGCWVVSTANTTKQYYGKGLERLLGRGDSKLTEQLGF
jgi:hypothetical protein